MPERACYNSNMINAILVKKGFEFKERISKWKRYFSRCFLQSPYSLGLKQPGRVAHMRKMSGLEAIITPIITSWRRQSAKAVLTERMSNTYRKIVHIGAKPDWNSFMTRETGGIVSSIRVVNGHSVFTDRIPTHISVLPLSKSWTTESSQVRTKIAKANHAMAVFFLPLMYLWSKIWT